MAGSLLFSNPDTWSGGFYELAVELGARSDTRLQTALDAVWSQPILTGCYRHSNIEPSAQRRLRPTVRANAGSHLFGLAEIPRANQVPCGTTVVRERSGPDWLVLYFPLAALESVYEVGAYPFDDGTTSEAWRVPLDSWLVEAAREVFSVVPYEMALIGHEVSGEDYALQVRDRGVPPERWMGYLWPDNGLLKWYPPTNYGPEFTFGE